MWGGGGILRHRGHERDSEYECDPFQRIVCLLCVSSYNCLIFVNAIYLRQSLHTNLAENFLSNVVLMLLKEPQYMFIYYAPTYADTSPVTIMPQILRVTYSSLVSTRKSQNYNFSVKHYLQIYFTVNLGRSSIA